MKMITLRAGLKLNSILPFAALKQEFPFPGGQFDPVSNTLSFALPTDDARKLMKKYVRSVLYTLVEVE